MERKKNIETRFATWNVRSLTANAKLENLKQEMKRMKVDVLGISEMRWPNNGDLWTGNYRLIHSGCLDDKPGIGGVGVLLTKELGQRVKGYVHRKGRILLVKLDTKPVDTVIIQVYMPTAKYEEKFVEEMYTEIQNLLDQIKGEDNVILMGDWNARVGEGEEAPFIGPFGYGTRNDRGARLVVFCAKNKLVVTNTCFQHHVRRRYTWKAPGDAYRTQIDYIMVKERYKNQIKDSRSYAGPDIDSDHNMVMAKGCLKLKKLKKKKSARWDIRLLKDNENKVEYETRTNDCEYIADGDIQSNWEIVKKTIKTAADSVLKKQRPQPRKEWITEEILNLIEKRRELKNATTEEGKRTYRELRNKINRESRIAKESYLEEKCAQISRNLEQGRLDSAYREAKNFFNDSKARSNTIEDENGKLLFDDEMITKRWKQYLESLYKGDDYNDSEILGNEEIGDNDTIQVEDFKKAVAKLKDNKAPGLDAIPAELIKQAGNGIQECLFTLIHEIYETGEMPTDFTQCKISVIPKKAGTNKCSEHRTLSLISHSSKILTNIMIKRIEDKIEATLTDDQFGFRKGKGTRDAMLALRMILEKQLKKKNRDTYIAFIDLEKAFDKVEWKKLFEILKDIGLNFKDRRIIWNLYKNETAVYECGEYAGEAKIRQGVRQGCCISALLFNCYIQKALDEMRREMETWPGIKVNGIKIDMIRYADDIALIAPSEEELKAALETMNKILISNYNMKINKNKTKIMIVSRNEDRIRSVIKLEDIELKQVKEFTYLGGKITEDGRSNREIQSRILQAKLAFNKKSKIFESHNIKLEIRKNLINTLVWSIALYGCESWTICDKDKNHLEAFEMWCYRRTLKIIWSDKITNEAVLERMKEERKILKLIAARRAKWIGHTLRHEGMLHNIIDGKIEGRNNMGRPRQEYMKQIEEDMKCNSYKELKELSENSTEWRRWNLLLPTNHQMIVT
uniref:Craniofacial development protein 2 n=1 Tax=Cacopsylla melanoneura TaxID=428564 RepID=A0A8D9A6I6_9HEMI